MRIATGTLLLALTACAVHEEWAWHHWSQIGLFDCTTTETLRLDSPASAAFLCLSVSARATAGTLHVELRDPAGALRFDETRRDAEPVAAMELPGMAGVWSCTITMVGFSGDCSIEFEARSGRAQDPSATTSPEAAKESASYRRRPCGATAPTGGSPGPELPRPPCDAGATR